MEALHSNNGRKGGIVPLLSFIYYLVNEASFLMVNISMNISALKINWHWLLAFLGLGIFTLALWSLYHTTQMVQWQDVKAAVVNIPFSSLLSALIIVLPGTGSSPTTI